MANQNRVLGKAKNAKKDEFYTQLSDIQNELNHYVKHFENKIVFCNCDDPYESNFFKFFCMNFRRFKLKKLIATCYIGSPIAESEIGLFKEGFIADEPIPEKGKRAIQFRISEIPDMNNDGAIDLRDAELLIQKRHPYRILHGDENYPAGDFRSNECIKLLKEADIVVTNPPFSLFREYVAQLMEYDKKFIIIGHQNAITYKEIFPLLKNNKMWLGFGFKGNAGFFHSVYEDTATSSQHKEGLIRVSGVNWFTNLDISKRHEDLILTETYAPEKYPKYDNYDAINVDKTMNIPYDYAGIMGVPITFLDKYNPEQFEIVGGSMYEDTPCRILRKYVEEGYKFLKADGITVSGSGALRDKISPKIPVKGKSDYSISPKGEYLSSVYQRIFIINKRIQKGEN